VLNNLLAHMPNRLLQLPVPDSKMQTQARFRAGLI
jgi:hypothetical protein